MNTVRTVPTWILILLIAMVIAAISWVLSLNLQMVVFQNRVLPFDHVSYVANNARAYVQLQYDGPWVVGTQWLNLDIRGLLLQLIMLFAFPETLSLPYGYQVVTVPIFALSLTAILWFIYSRTECLLYAIAATAAFALLPFLFRFDAGLGAFLPDVTASGLVLAAGISLLQSEQGRNWKQVLVFGVLVSLAALTRYVSSIYMLAMFGPLIGYYAILQFLRERRFWPPLRFVLISGGVPAILAGYWIFHYFLPWIGYYRAFGVVSYPVSVAAHDFVSKMELYFGGMAPISLLVFGGVGLGIWQRLRGAKLGSLLELAWLSMAHMVLLILAMRSANHETAAAYAGPFLFLLAVSPFSQSISTKRRTGFLKLIIPLVLISLGLLGYQRKFQEAKHSAAEIKQEKKLAIQLGEAASRNGPETVWVTFFDHLTLQASMEEFYRGGTLPLLAGEDHFFHIREAPLRHLYAGSTPEQAGDMVVARLNHWVNLIVVHDDLTTLEANMRQHGMENEYTVGIARHVATWAPTAPGWEKVFVIENTPYGRLAGYRNRSPHPGGYLRRLRGGPLLVN